MAARSSGPRFFASKGTMHHATRLVRAKSPSPMATLETAEPAGNCAKAANTTTKPEMRGWPMSSGYFQEPSNYKHGDGLMPAEGDCETPSSKKETPNPKLEAGRKSLTRIFTNFH